MFRTLLNTLIVHVDAKADKGLMCWSASYFHIALNVKSENEIRKT